MILRPFFVALAVAPLAAEEITVESSPFRVEQSFKAAVLPAEPESFTLAPESWESFTIETLADHGAAVKKGETLVGFEREAYDRRVEDLRRKVALDEIAVAEAALTLEKLRKDTEIRLAAARQAKRDADEDLAYFKETGRPAAEASVNQNLASSEFRLAAEQEELKQLREMYRKDDLTEDTEEIILERQKFAVESAEFSLSEAKRRAQKTLETELPRQLETLERTARGAALALTEAEGNLPRQVKRAALELEGGREALAREQLELERLESDAALFEWKAPADGIFVHGSVEDGQWQLGDLAKSLKPGGAAPTRRALITLVPADAAPAFSARLEPEQARALDVDTPLTVTLPGREDLVLAGSVSAIAPLVATDGKQHVALDLTWPEDRDIPWLAELSCLAVAYENAEAVHVPADALTAAANGGWTLEIKLADGKTERREVTTGRANGKRIEITSGLEPGQVVIQPES